MKNALAQKLDKYMRFIVYFLVLVVNNINNMKVEQPHSDGIIDALKGLLLQFKVDDLVVEKYLQYFRQLKSIHENSKNQEQINNLPKWYIDTLELTTDFMKAGNNLSNNSEAPLETRVRSIIADFLEWHYDKHVKDSGERLKGAMKQFVTDLKK